MVAARCLATPAEGSIGRNVDLWTQTIGAKRLSDNFGLSSPISRQKPMRYTMLKQSKKTILSTVALSALLMTALAGCEQSAPTAPATEPAPAAQTAPAPAETPAPAEAPAPAPAPAEAPKS